MIQANLDFASNHAKLVPFINKGQIDFALLNAEDVNQIGLYKSGITLTHNSLHNPLVVIANNVFGSLKQDLIAIHYGKFFDGYIAAAPIENKELNFTEDLQYDWRELPDTHQYDSTLLDQYLRYLNSNPILVPTGAINCLDSLSQFTQLPSLVLSADSGISTLQQLRQQAAPEFANDASLSLPVNYHALGLLTATHGGIAMNCQRQSNSVAMSALILNTEFYANIESPFTNTTNNALNRSSIGSKTYNQIREAFLIHVDQFNPGDATFLSHVAKQASHQCAPEIILNYLRLSRWDYQIIDVYFDNLLQQIDQLQPDERNQWKAALQCTWENYYPVGNSIEVSAKIGLLATDLRLWGLAKSCFKAIFDSQKNIESFEVDICVCYFKWAVCCFQLGQFKEANTIVRRALKFSRDNSGNKEQCAYLLQEISRYQKLPKWYESKLFSQGELILQPLMQMHAADVSYQTRDPSICVMAKLPNFETLGEVEKWIDESTKSAIKNDETIIVKKIALAVIHENWGFVGIVSLQISDKSAFFLFWTGIDYQGQGFGPIAAKILIKATQQVFNIRNFFTTVYNDNYRSLKALQNVGWQRLPFIAESLTGSIIDKKIQFLMYGGNQINFTKSFSKINLVKLHMQKLLSENDSIIRVSDSFNSEIQLRE